VELLELDLRALKVEIFINSVYVAPEVWSVFRKSMVLAHFLKYFFIVYILMLTKLSFAYNYRILVLPSGGATGLIPATFLVELERRTGKPVYQLFDEIWGSSIGAMIASLLTVPADGVVDGSAPPKTALEVQEFIEQVFSSYWRAARILKEFRKSVPKDLKLKDTKIPVRILSAEVKAWRCGGLLHIPSKTALKSFCQQDCGNLSLSSIACSSCVIPPVHRYEVVALENGECMHCLDAGHEYCGKETEMNPLFFMMEQFSREIQVEKDTLSVFFLSNGWIRLHPSWGSHHWVDMPGHNGSTVRVNLFNLDVDLNPAIEQWKNQKWYGKILTRLSSKNTLDNLAGIGTLPRTILKQHAEQILQNSDVFHEMVEFLSRTPE